MREIMQMGQGTPSAELIEKVVLGGNLAVLTAEERMNYYKSVCDSLGLNPLTRPFDYIQLNGKLVLYAKKDCADQLRKINGVDIDDVDMKEVGDNYVVTVKGHDKNGRKDLELGVVSKRDMQGNQGNAMMKAVTKAKRRLTLSLCGLGWLDETEVETIPGARVVPVTESGEIANVCDSPYDIPEDFVPLNNPSALADSNGVKYTDKTDKELVNMYKTIQIRKTKGGLSAVQLAELETKKIGIQTILIQRKNGGE